MTASKLKLIRIFVFWGQVEPARNQWDFTSVDLCFKETQSCGMKIVVTLISMYKPLWMGGNDLLESEI